MQPIRYCLFLCLIIFLSHCASDTESSGPVIPSIAISYIDSIPLFNDSITYPYVNIEKIDQDTILAFNYPSLNLYLLDKQGEIKSLINKKGDLKGEFKNIFIAPLWGPDGKLYVLEQGSSSKVTVFDKDLNFAYSASPFQNTDEYFLSLIQASSLALPAADNSVQFVASISNNLYSNYSRENYEKMQSVVHFTVQDDKVSRSTIQLPYKDIPSVQEALRKDQKNWDAATAYFDHWDDRIFVKYEFDHEVYVYDLNFNLLETITLHPAFPGKNMSVPMEAPENTQKRLSTNFALRYSQPYYYSISVADGVIFTLYSKPVAKDLIPKTVAEERDFIASPVLHIYDTESKEEYSVDLGNRIDPYAGVTAHSGDEIYLLGNTKLTEDIYLYQTKINY